MLAPSSDAIPIQECCSEAIELASNRPAATMSFACQGKSPTGPTLSFRHDTRFLTVLCSPIRSLWFPLPRRHSRPFSLGETSQDAAQHGLVFRVAKMAFSDFFSDVAQPTHKPPRTRLSLTLLYSL
jgi:hypothetical protein